MDFERAIRVLTDLEERYDVNAIRFASFRAWPLVRCQLWSSLLFTGSNSKLSAPSARPWSARQGLTKLARLALDVGQDALQRRDASWGENEILFYSHASDHFTRIGGSLVAIHADPIQDLLEREHTCCKLELDTPAADLKKQSRVRPPIFVNPRHRLRCYKALQKLRPDRVSGLRGLVNLVEELSGARGLLDEDRLLADCRSVAAYAAFFRKLLRSSRLRAAFVVCYYHLDGMGLIHACRDLGIRTIDIQHGKQGKFQGLYTHWTRIPSSGYELLPHRFFVWGEESRANISDTRPTPVGDHLPVVGGYPWLHRWKGAGAQHPQGIEVELLEWLKGSERVILVSLQPLLKLPEHLVAAMRQAPGNWRWLVRLHPGHGDDSRRGFLDQLQDVPRATFELDRAGRVPLHFLLGHATHHVTLFSSVCYEALALGVPSVVTHPAAGVLYRKYIEQGVFDFCETAGEIIQSLSGKRDLKVPHPPYIETDPTITEAALARALGPSE